MTSRCAKKQQRTYRRKFTHRIVRSLSPVQTTGKFPCVRYGHPDRVYVEKRCGSCFMYSTVVGRHIVRHWRVLQKKINSRINNVIYDPRWHPFRGERDKIGGDRGKEAKNPDENPNKLPHTASTWYLFFDTSALLWMLSLCIIVGIIIGEKQNAQLDVL